MCVLIGHLKKSILCPSEYIASCMLVYMLLYQMGFEMLMWK